MKAIASIIGEFFFSRSTLFPLILIRIPICQINSVYEPNFRLCNNCAVLKDRYSPQII